ncbi:hypothetical protein [Paenibacillus sp. RC67]|uniref:hypothetical protein n=1 Tax=Paenibacillus sp. RC67 TaxID=3039392 RepID=UPI0024AE57BA|nr:hypothetical protein [Paenibacillus sp. RC67]
MTTIVGILGLSHDEECREKYGMHLDFLRELIIEFNPDIICGEVIPSTWDLICKNKAGEGYWANPDQNYKSYWAEPASEYWKLIFPLCKERGIRFEPVDWLEMDVWWDFDPFAPFSEAEQERLKLELSNWTEKQLAVCGNSPIPFNSFELDDLTRGQFEWMGQVNPIAQAFRWTHRHLIMIQRIKNVIKKNPDSTILCIAGYGHNYCYYNELKGEPVHLIYPLR